ncbi:pectate lyase family protein [Uliginosibacterium aquaticum]|uniref:Pectate lyase n=1 Tax=Uliginosibacterium aquaticum TaxID=2731212 RepID=A0ABX2ICS5_9RHOO|nr:pectate lyase [Uliginosibacterium aquaticum]NSL54183.1 pectate lyase [Uliginosibacterium aquaticum]
MSFKLKATAAAIAMLTGSAFAASTGGFATADGNISTARKFTVSTYAEINTIIANARYNDAGTKVATGAYPLHIVYTGNEDALIAQIVKDSTKDSSGNCPAPHWSDAYRYVEVKNYTAGVTIEGANGSSANFGIVLNGGTSNVVVKNMKIGALGGASNDADMFRIDSASNVLIDHNEMFAVNNECNGSPDGDLTFESAIDIKKASHNITVSYNYIHDSKKVGLDGSSSSDIDGGREITYHHNYYKNVNARLPLQRGGWIHVYNNLYDGITGSGINTRQAGYALIERNYFQNAVNPVVCFYDSGSNCGFWDLRNNNILSTADFATYNITWTTPASGDKSASAWTNTATFPKTLTYTYEPVTAQCVKDKLASYAGVGKNGAVLTASACSGSTSSTAASSAASSSAAASSAAASSAAASSTAASSAAASSAAASSAAASSSASTAPTLTGTGDYPDGFSKCAALGETCSVTKGTGWVAFGRKGKWVTKYVGVGKSVACTVAVFGVDPLGDPNKCSYQQ